MGLFDNVTTAQDVEPEKDRVKGKRQPPLNSDIYNLVVKYAYAQKSKGGALGVNLVFTVSGENREVRFTEWVTSGDNKGNKNFYEMEVDGKKTKRFLPGFTMIEELCLLTLGKGLFACTSEKKTISLWNRDAKAEKPTEVDMFTELIGKSVRGAITRNLEDRTAKNETTGKYEPTGKTFETNMITKYLDATTSKTASEKAADVDADYQEKWLDKWKGVVDDQSTKVEAAGTAGAPQGSGSAAPKTSLFGGA